MLPLYLPSHHYAFKTSEKEKKVVVVSMSPQSRASIAARYDLSSTDAGRRLTSFFKGLGECRYNITHTGKHSLHLLSLLQVSIMCLTQPLLGLSVCLRARGNFWSDFRGRSWTKKVCQ